MLSSSIQNTFVGSKMSERRAETDSNHPDEPHADKAEADMSDVQEEVPDDIEEFYSELGGEIVDKIREYSDDIDLIIMGTHRRSGVRRFIYSRAEEVVRNADCPVLTVELTED